ncbi:MAG: serine/threonine protein kinase, partial [Gemmataceae bacterium]|nr:serine/threonine protein kinase [Gemmataceae bacterium]
MTRSDPVPRCRVALDGPTTRRQGDATRLLHGRLRLVTLLALVPFFLFLVRNLADPLHHETTGMVLHAIVTAFLGGLALMLWLMGDWTECQLRQAELALVAATAGFFCWQQSALYRHPAVFDAAEACGDLDVVRLWINASALRWFFLIVIYGVFIPGSWKRCAAVAGTLMLLPVALTLLGAYAADLVRGDVLYGMSDLVILLGTGVAVAVFGSWRMEALREQALEAQQLGQYRLKRLIGKGGMGEVHEAEHVLLRRPCAVKLIRPGPTRDDDALARFEREVQAMATLTHPNSVDVYDYGRAADGTLYYVMEYLPGLTLDQLVDKHGPVPPGRAIHLLRQLCRALREAHSIGLLHRDLKPSNVMVCERGGEQDVAKLLDYGLVQGPSLGEEAKRLTVQGMVLGSPPYMPPEQAAGRQDIDARAD